MEVVEEEHVGGFIPDSIKQTRNRYFFLLFFTITITIIII